MSAQPCTADELNAMSALDAARVYTANGYRVVPVPHRQKKCPLPDWPNLDLNESDLPQHFPPGRPMNLGLLTGTRTRLVDVDLDCPEAVAAAGHLLPATTWVSGRKGSPTSHRWYACDDAPPSEQYLDVNGKTVLAELQSDGRQSVVPPSVHELGDPIVWHRWEARPTAVSGADLRRAVRRTAAAALLARHWPEEGRHFASLALAGGLFRAGWTAEAVEQFLVAVTDAAGDEETRARVRNIRTTEAKWRAGAKTTGWPRLRQVIGTHGPEVVRRVLEWLGLRPDAGAAGGTRPRYVAPYIPFPVGLLPEPLATYVREAAAAVPCDPGYIAPHVLAACAGCIGLTRVLRLKGGRRNWSEPPIVWAAVIAYSGTCKSPAFDVAIEDVQEIETELNEEYQAAAEQYKADLRAFKRAKEEGEEPAPPVERRLRVQETTIEALAITLSQNRRLLLARDELRGWVEGFKKYKGKAGGTDMPQWLELHRGNPISVDRKTGDHRKVRVPRSAVSACGTIQPRVIGRAFDADAFDAGLVARILLCMPPRQPKRWSDVEVPDAVAETYARLIRALFALDYDTSGVRPVPHALRLSPAAQARFKRFVNEWGAKTFAATEAAAASNSKLEGYAARFALIFHVVRHAHAGTSDLCPVELDDLERGIALAHWFADEAERVYAALRDPDDPLRELAEWVARRPGRRCTAKDLQKARGREYPTADDAAAALQQLVDAGYGEWADRPAGPKGGRPTRDFRLFDPPARPADETDETPPADGAGGPGGADETADQTRPAAGESPDGPGETGVSSVSSAGMETRPPVPAGSQRTSAREAWAGVSSATDPGAGGGAGHLLVTDPAGLGPVAAGLCDAERERVYLDAETTGLDPRADRVRLLSLSLPNGDGGRVVYLIDCFAVDPSPLWEALAACEVVGHNLAFDLAFLSRLGFRPGRVRDTMLLSQVLHASGYARGVAPTRHGLKECAAREAGVALDKDLQTSDWSGPLTADQLAYAAADVRVLEPLHAALTAKLAAAGLERAAEIECRALPAVVWMGSAGVPFDKECWAGLAAAARADADRARAALDVAAPADPAALFATGWNWDSPEEVKRALAVAGVPVESTRDNVLARLDHPLAALLRDHRDARKRETTYGADWLKHVAADGRVYPRWVQLGANSGRMACSTPNMQNLPRGDYRKCIAAPPGRLLVKADYSQVELRIAAKVSGDKALLAAYQRGEDLHTLTARQVLGLADVTKSDRQLAKALNFGLLYGMGARGFRDYARANYGLELTEDQAAHYRAAFFKAYPGLRRWHNSVGDRPRDTRTLTGRRVLKVERFTEKLNLPVQGTGADGLKVALGLLWDRRAECPDAVPVLAVHDELVVECDARRERETAEWLRTAMVDAIAPLIQPVPVEAEVKAGRTWGGE